MSTRNDIRIFKLKENNPLKVYYIKTIWKIDSLKDLSGSDEDNLCELIVTNCNSFWTRNGNDNLLLLLLSLLYCLLLSIIITSLSLFHYFNLL